MEAEKLRQETNEILLYLGLSDCVELHKQDSINRCQLIQTMPFIS